MQWSPLALLMLGQPELSTRSLNTLGSVESKVVPTLKRMRKSSCCQDVYYSACFNSAEDSFASLVNLSLENAKQEDTPLVTSSPKAPCICENLKLPFTLQLLTGSLLFNLLGHGQPGL